MSTKKENPFVAAAVAGVEKTKKQVATEKAEEFLAEARTEVVVQIAQANAEVIRSKASLTKAKNVLKKAQADFEVARYVVPSDGTLDSYISNRNYAEEDVESTKSAVTYAEAVVTTNEAKVKAYEAVQKDVA